MSDRRKFVSAIAGLGLTVGATSCTRSAVAEPLVTHPAQNEPPWLARIRRAGHRAVFDSPGSDAFLMLAARYLDNIQSAYGLVAPDVAAVANVRTRAVGHALTNAMWAKYPIGEDYDVKEPNSEAFARRNVNYDVTPGMSEAMAGITYERLLPRGLIVLVCDFALGHLANRMAKKMSLPVETVQQELRAGLVPGAFLVSSGIFGLAEAQNAGCAFVPA